MSFDVELASEARTYASEEYGKSWDDLPLAIQTRIIEQVNEHRTA